MKLKIFLIIGAIVGLNLLSGCQNISGLGEIQLSDEDISALKMYNAVFNDNASLAVEALEMGENPNEFSSDKVASLSAKFKREKNPLAMAVHKRSYEVADILLRNGADADALNVDGATILELSNIEFAKKLVECGADVNRKNSDGKCVFEVKASLLGEPEVIEWAKLCIENSYEVIPAKVRESFDYNNEKPYGMIKYLREQGFEIMLSETDELFYKAAFGTLKSEEADTVITNTRGETLINIAAKYGNLINVKLLLEKGADIRVEGHNGLYDALDYAIENGHMEIVKYFAEKGKFPIRREEHVYTTTERNLIQCVKSGNYNCLSYVLEAFNKIYDKDDFTSAACAAVKADNTDCLRLLLNLGADIDKAAEECLISGDVEIARLLCEFGADFGKINNALWYAIEFHDKDEGFELAKFLIENFPNLVQNDSSAMTAAIESGSLDAAKLLLGSGIDVNKRYFDKDITALMCAADSTDEIFRYLTELGADKYAEDTDGKTVRDYLNFYGCVDRVKMSMLDE